MKKINGINEYNEYKNNATKLAEEQDWAGLKTLLKEWNDAVDVWNAECDLDDEMEITPADIKEVLDSVEHVDVTSGINGYPKNLHGAYVSDTQSELQEFADAVGGSVVKLRKRDGWQFYEEYGSAYLPYTFSAEDMHYGEDVRAHDAHDEHEAADTFFNEEAFFVDNEMPAPTLDDDVVTKARELEDGDTMVLLCTDEMMWADTIFRKEQTRWHDSDVWTYQFAVIL